MLQFKSNAQEFVKKVSDRKSNLGKFYRQSLRNGMRSFLSYIQKDQLTGRPGTKVRSGTLRRDWNLTNYDAGMDFTVRLSSPTKYAAIHQYGGEVKSSRPNGYLAIPVEGTMTQSEAAQGPRSNPRLRLFIGAKSKLPYLAEEFGKPLWLLRKSVNIPKRLHIHEAFQSKGPYIIRSALLQNVKKVLGKS